MECYGIRRPQAAYVASVAPDPVFSSISRQMPIMQSEENVLSWPLTVANRKPFYQGPHYLGLSPALSVLELTALMSSLTSLCLVVSLQVERFHEDLQDLLELTPEKDVLFIIGDWNVKVGSQEIPGVTGKFGFGVQNKVGQRPTVLPRECTGHSKHPLPTTQEKTLHRDVTRWSTPQSD